MKRCISSTRGCLTLGFISTAIVSVFMIFLRYSLVSLFTSDEEVIKIAAMRISIIVGFEVLNMAIEVLSGALRGLGRSLTPALICVFGICGARIAWLFWIFPMNRTFGRLFAIYPISWAFATAGLAISYFIVKRRLVSTKS